MPGLLGTRRAAAPYSLSGVRGTAPAPDRPRTRPRGRAWADLLRVSALFTVPGDALAGAAAAGRRPDRGTALAVGASLCLYEAGMALNDWADRDEDAVDRPHRPIPSGRISPAAALTAAGVLTAAGLALAARAGRPALAVASGLAATVWAYDLRLKHTPLGPAAMATARSLDLLLGAAATGRAGDFAPASPGRAVTAGTPGASAAATTRTGTGAAGKPGPAGPVAAGGPPARTTRPAAAPAAAGRTAPVRTPRSTGAATVRPVRAALLLGAHTYAVTEVSRHEARGGSTAAPLAALAATAALGAAAARDRPVPPPGSGERPTATAHRLLRTALAAAYLRTAATPLLHAALNPSPPLTQRAVGGGIRAMIPLQAALAVKAGAPLNGLATMALVPLARKLARKVSPT
ncbi:SCO3242 family prenyltransferase [Streptomyces griseus]|uniref:SCO3242 family prenyltransferase n=1 Tax=Streptomyces griseus TaxID=1911 RepID=UPI001586AE4B|nr:UbiA family prenyltransferase [Streptomyces griseus]